MRPVRRQVGRQVVKQEHEIGFVRKAKRNKHNRSKGRNFRGMSEPEQGQGEKNTAIKWGERNVPYCQISWAENDEVHPWLAIPLLSANSETIKCLHCSSV